MNNLAANRGDESAASDIDASQSQNPTKRSRKVSERACRRVIARHRAKVDWMLRVPQWEELFGEGLVALGLPQPRRGINLRAVLDSLLLENKYQLIIWMLEQFSEQFPASVAHRISEFYGLGLFKYKDLDEYLTEKEWMKFQEYIHSSLTWEHLRYKRAQTVMFRRYQSFLHKLTNRLVFDASKRQDGFQEASLGLLHAIDKVDESATAFSSYARTWITRHIRNFLMGEHFPVHVPVNLASKLLTNASAKEAEKKGPEPLPSQAEKKEEEPYANLLKPRVSIEEMAENEKGGQEIPDKEMSSPRENMSKEDLFVEIRNLMEELTEKQREVITLRYGLNSKSETHTLSGIASKVGISHQQVSMRERRALQKLESLLRPLYQEAFE